MLNSLSLKCIEVVRNFLMSHKYASQDSVPIQDFRTRQKRVLVNLLKFSKNFMNCKVICINYPLHFLFYTAK
jgi:hypothetical protein